MDDLWGGTRAEPEQLEHETDYVTACDHDHVDDPWEGTRVDVQVNGGLKLARKLSLVVFADLEEEKRHRGTSTEHGLSFA